MEYIRRFDFAIHKVIFIPRYHTLDKGGFFIH
jgi:hypothetical protein